MAQKRTAQVGLKIEATEGTEEALVAADFSGNRKDTNDTVEIARYDRGLERATLTPLQTLAGSQMGRVTFTEEMVGGSAANQAKAHETLRSMGFSRSALKKYALTGVANASSIRPGQMLGNGGSLGASAKTGMVAAFVAGAGATGTLWVLPFVGGDFSSGDTLSNFGSPAFGATTSGAAAAGGHAFAPLSEFDDGAGTITQPPSVTIERQINGERHTFVGCRANGSIIVRRDEPVQLQAEFMGAPVVDVSGGGWRKAAPTASVPVISAPPKVAKNTGLRMRDASGTEFVPVLTEATIELGNTVTGRATLGTSIGDSGYLGFRITGRDLRMRLNPEEPRVSVFDLPKQFFSGVPMAIDFSIGAPGDTHGMLVFYAPAAQFDQNLEASDRDGLITRDTNVKLCGTNDDELRIFHVFN